MNTKGPSSPDPGSFASRGGLKLARALDHFGIDPAGMVCADLGCSTGGFTDCLLQRGASKVYAVDTAYGELAWKLRSDARVVVMERTNALHAVAPEPASLVTIDLGWTRQSKAIPAALRWLAPGGRILTLIKPHYEIDTEALDRIAPGRVLDEPDAERIASRVAEQLAEVGARTLGIVKSPILGGAGKKSRGRGNAEWIALVERDPTHQQS